MNYQGENRPNEATRIALRGEKLIERLQAIGLKEIALARSTGRYRAFQGKGMLGDQYVLVGKNGGLRVGSDTRTSVALQANVFVALLEKRMNSHV